MRGADDVHFARAIKRWRDGRYRAERVEGEAKKAAGAARESAECANHDDDTDDATTTTKQST